MLCVGGWRGHDLTEDGARAKGRLRVWQLRAPDIPEGPRGDVREVPAQTLLVVGGDIGVYGGADGCEWEVAVESLIDGL